MAQWIDIKLKDGTPLKSWIVYPERPDKARRRAGDS